MSQLDNARLLSIIERIEHINEEISGLTSDRKDIMLEAKSAGFDTKAITHVIKQRKKNAQQRDEESNLFAVYEHAVGL
jgi:uncharacterized protein (UPF0335 family)